MFQLSSSKKLQRQFLLLLIAIPILFSHQQEEAAFSVMGGVDRPQTQSLKRQTLKESVAQEVLSQMAYSSGQELYHSGIIAYRKGRYDQAAQLMHQVITQQPQWANAHYYLAICLDLLDRDQSALKHYQSVLKLSEEKEIRAYAQQRVLSIDSHKSLANPPVNTLSSGISTRRSQWGISQPLVRNGIVSLKQNKNALMVEAVLTNRKTGKQARGTFIIDTGATYTSISQEMAEQLGLNLDTGETVHITTANGKIDVPKVSIDQLRVEGVEAQNIQATVIHVRPDSSFSGLLGLSFIRQFKMTIDPSANQLVFEPND